MTELKVWHRQPAAKPEHGRVIRLNADHSAVVNGTSMFPHLVREPIPGEWVLKKGEHNRKIGSRVTKKKWRGFPIYTLTLEERASCPQSCPQWSICYGNHMSLPRSYRYRHGSELESQLDNELLILSSDPKSRNGFVVRLHVLGDFYSVEYVRKWESWLKEFPALHLFGFTAWPIGTDIGDAVADLRDRHWDRFAIRTSNDVTTNRSAGVIADTSGHEDRSGAFVCPAETGKTDCCGTCGLCWTSDKRVLFVEH